ncbi:MAG: hypothetical protein M1338_02815 [Patescibacteria group bacterium]|nr:hypothetical protein [Patescibacteria group bacterium]
MSMKMLHIYYELEEKWKEEERKIEAKIGLILLGVFLLIGTIVAIIRH